MFVGYDMVKDGNILWSLPINSDHTDEIIYAASLKMELSIYIWHQEMKALIL